MNQPPQPSQTLRSPITWLLDLFSSIWLGIWLLVLLFVYSAVGSVGLWLPGRYASLLRHDWIHDVYFFWISWTQVHIRQSPWLEMTEFEWFHWWPFNLLIALICINIIVATLRRIPLNVLNIGVWMIHSGIIILALGSVIYFALKLEGDSLIVRRQIVVEVDGHPPVSFIASPGAMKTIETETGEYTMRVMSIDPNWEILTGEDAGKRAYAVSIAVRSAEHQFVRQLLAEYPQYTEDSIWTGRLEQPMVRAVRELGTPIVDDSIRMSLAYNPEEHFYLVNSRAVYVREKGEREWAVRPIHDMPRYNDRLDSSSAAWLPSALSDRLPVKPIELPVTATEAHDPLPDSPMHITSFVRYGELQSHIDRGNESINPAIAVQLRGEGGEMAEYQMLAFDDATNIVEDGRLHFVWASTDEEFEALTHYEDARLRFVVPAQNVDVKMSGEFVADGAFTEVPGTGYAYRVESVQGPLNFGGPSPVTVAIIAMRIGDRTFYRWVFDDGREPMDFGSAAGGPMHGEQVALDESVQVSFTPRTGPRQVTIIAGPADDDLHLMVNIASAPPEVLALQPRTPVRIQRSITLEVLNYAARARSVTKPMLIPPNQREREAGQFQSLIRLHVPNASGGPVWLPYHHFAFRDAHEVPRRFRYLPQEVQLADGRVLEVMFSRDRRKLPAPVVLDDFQVVAHVGGFTGDTSSIRDWVSRVRFDTENGWTDPMLVSMNKPANFEGYWFFQAQWDPPQQSRGEGDVASAGLNYTVLGVGNRHGVWTQLFGCCVAVAGMIYVFYIKPVLKRRRQQQVLAQLRSEQAADAIGEGVEE